MEKLCSKPATANCLSCSPVETKTVDPFSFLAYAQQRDWLWSESRLVLRPRLGRPADGLGAELGMRTGLGRFGTGGRLGQPALTPVSIPQSAAGVRKLSRDGALGPCHRPASRGIGSSRWNKIYGVGTGRGAMGSGRPAGNISASGLRGLSGLGKEGQECRRLCPSSVGLPGSGRAGLRCQLRLTPSSPSQPWRGEGANRKPQD